MSPFRMKLAQDIVPLDAPGKFVADKEGVASLAVAGIAIAVAAIGFDASGTESLLTGLLAFWGALTAMPYKMK